MNANVPNIWLMQTENDWQGLAKALKHPDADIRRRAAVALRVIDAKDAVSVIHEALETEANPQVRVVLLAALDHLEPHHDPTKTNPKKRPQSRAERLIEHLTSGTPDRAVQAAKSLGELDDKIAVPPLIAVFRNRNHLPKVRLAAAEALLVMNSAPAEVTLLAALRSEKRHLRRNGAAILGQLKADWAVEPLSQALHDESELVSKTARAALRHIGTIEARKALAEAKKSIIDTSELDRSRFISRVEQMEQRDKKTGGKPVAPPQAAAETAEQAAKEAKLPDTSKLRRPDRAASKKGDTGTLKAPIEEPNPPSEPPPPPPTLADAVSAARIPQPDKPTPPAPIPPNYRPPATAKPQPKKPPSSAAETPPPRPSQPKKPLSQTERLKSRRRKSSTKRLVPPPDMPDLPDE